MTDTLRDRIAAVLDKALPESASDVGFYQRLGVTPLVDIEAYDLNLELLADAVIRELADEFVNFGAWLAEEITGRTMTRIDLESCLQEWKWLHDESRWLKGETDAD